MFTNYRSPLGNLVITFNENKILAIKKSHLRKNTDKKTDVVKDLTTQLDRYFDGDLDALFKVPLKNLQLSGTEFQKNVWKVLKKIKPTQTLTYSEIALKLNTPKAYRAVGSAVGKNPFFILLPCHRVLGQNKKLCGFAYGIDVKKTLLRHENLEFIA